MGKTLVKDGSIVRKPGAFEKRIHEIDFIRGFLIALVVIDHILCWFYQYGVDFPTRYWISPQRAIIRFIALFLFVFISGVSTAFSKNNWVRAGQMLAFAGILYVGSALLDYFLSDLIGTAIRVEFNIIAVLAWSTLFYCFASGKTWRSLVIGLLISFLLSWYMVPNIKTYFVQHGITPNLAPLFDPWSFNHGYADWMPLFPFIMFFFMGAIFSYFYYVPTKKSLIKYRGNWERPICFMGRHSLLIYAGHQLILIPVFVALGPVISQHLGS